MTDESSEPENVYAAALAGIPTEELRLALVLNGGVSLAVWMGGVAHEIDRLTRSITGEPSNEHPYGSILAAAKTTATVDIISGTSAGGINGAALALAQANNQASLLGLRTLWQEQGRMEELLRQPFQGKPTSLLRGDDYFLPELLRAMRMLATPFEARVSGDKPYIPIDLTLTTTLLNGAQEITIDDFGQQIPQRVHTGLFRFRNIEEGGRRPEPEDDPFSKQNIERTARAMALAARCTASFPFAFEPSFVPVDKAFPDDDLRVDMSPYASWAGKTGDDSRFAMDGGVLANTPLMPTLEAIDRRQADGPVRRSLLLVFPHAPAAAETKADKVGEPPGALGSLGKALGALMAQGSRSFVDKVDEHNRQAGDWRGSQEEILTGFGAAGSPVRQMFTMLGSAWPHYRHDRVRLAARGLAGKVQPKPQWSYERIRNAAETAQREWTKEHGGLPYVPHEFRWDQADWQQATLGSTHCWVWGDSAARDVAEAVASVLRAALSVSPDQESKAPLAVARTKVGEYIGAIQRARRRIDQIWLADEGLFALAPDQKYWRARIASYERAMMPGQLPSHRAEWTAVAPQESSAYPHINELNGSIGQSVAAAVRGAVGLLLDKEVRQTLEHLAALPAGADAVSGLHRWCRFLYEDPLTSVDVAAETVVLEPRDEIQRVLLRLLALHAATRLLAEGAPTGGNLPVRLAELSLRIEHPWAQFSRTPDDKAAGLELSRFGGFLKRSWRMNDWTWGRLDAITMLCQIVLDPLRLRRIAAMVAGEGGAPRPAEEVAREMLATIRDGLYGPRPEDGVPGPETSMEQKALAELTKALGSEGASLRHLPDLARWAAFPLQAEVILEELPELVSAIRLDTEDGAGRPTRGTRFIEGRTDLFASITGLPAPPPGVVTTAQRLTKGGEALLAFDQAGIGREQLAGETGSNALIRTASNAAGVMATVMDTEAARMPAIKPVTSAVRGALLLPYWLVSGLAGGGSVARFLASVGLIAGGLFLALSLFGVLGGFAAAAGLAGGATLLAAFGYSALKTGSLLHACALLLPVGPLLAFAFESGDGSKGATRVLIVLAVVLGLFVLANIPWPLQSPLTWWSTAPGASAMRKRGPRLAGLVLLAVVAAPVGFLLTTFALDRWSDSWLANTWVALTLAVVATGAVFGIGIKLALVHGRLLRLWRPVGSSQPSYQTPGSASGTFHELRVSDPAGVAATWAPLYGAAYLALAWLLGLGATFADNDAWDTWEVASVAWLAGGGVLLCLVAPIAVTRPARSRVQKLVQRAWVTQTEAAVHPPDPGAPPVDQRPQQLLHALLKYDSSFGYLVQPAPGATTTKLAGHDSALRSTTALGLTRAGNQLLARLDDPPPASPLATLTAPAAPAQP